MIIYSKTSEKMKERVSDCFVDGRDALSSSVAIEHPSEDTATYSSLEEEGESFRVEKTGKSKKQTK